MEEVYQHDGGQEDGTRCRMLLTAMMRAGQKLRGLIAE